MMCGIVQKIAAFFTAPDLKKCTPGYVVSGCNAVNITLPDMITTITLIYTIVLLVGAIPGLFKTYDFLKDRHNHAEHKSDDNQ